MKEQIKTVTEGEKEKEGVNPKIHYKDLSTGLKIVVIGVYVLITIFIIIPFLNGFFKGLNGGLS